MKILYATTSSSGSTSEHRLRALRRLGHAVDEFFYDDELFERGSVEQAFTRRLLTSPLIGRMNRNLLDRAIKSRPSIVWLDKPTMIYPVTVQRMSALGLKAVSYNPDDPFGPRRDGVWRHFIPALPFYWAHIVPREISKQEYEARGAVRVARLRFGFEPTIHFPPERLGLTAVKDLDVSFIGYPHDERRRWLYELAAKLPNRRVAVFGPGWRRPAAGHELSTLSLQGPVWNDQYREVIWRSKVSLAFITRSNRDEMSRKAIEIAAAGTAVVMQRSEVHRGIFGDSAFWFDDPAELADVVTDALSNPERDKMGSRAAEAVRKAGLSNDDILRGLIAQIQDWGAE